MTPAFGKDQVAIGSAPDNDVVLPPPVAPRLIEFCCDNAARA